MSRGPLMAAPMCSSPMAHNPYAGQQAFYGAYPGMQWAQAQAQAQMGMGMGMMAGSVQGGVPVPLQMVNHGRPGAMMPGGVPGKCE